MGEKIERSDFVAIATDCSVMTGENTDTARLELYQLTGEGLLKKEGENI